MELTITPRVLADTLTLEIALRNTVGVDVYVEQFLPGLTWPPTRGGFVYAQRDGLLLVYFGTVPNPPLTSLAQEVKLYAELLPSGQTLQASVRMTIPVLECGKVAAPDPAAPHELIDVDRVRVVVCYQPKKRFQKLREAVPGSGLYDPGGGLSHPSVEATVALPRPIPAQRRTERFDHPFEPDARFPPFPPLPG